MKAYLFSSLTYILVIMLIIPGTISGMASAVDEEPRDSDSLDTADSSKETGKEADKWQNKRCVHGG